MTWMGQTINLSFKSDADLHYRKTVDLPYWREAKKKKKSQERCGAVGLLCFAEKKKLAMATFPSAL